MAIDDSQDQAEALDDDKLGGDYPPEEPLGVEEYGTTAAEERYGEPLDERIRREEPEVGEGDGREPDSPPVLVDPDGVEADVLASAVPGSADDLGELDVDDPVGGDPTLRDVATELEAPMSAEEAAVHVIDD